MLLPDSSITEMDVHTTYLEQTINIAQWCYCNFNTDIQCDNIAQFFLYGKLTLRHYECINLQTIKQSYEWPEITTWTGRISKHHNHLPPKQVNFSNRYIQYISNLDRTVHYLLGFQLVKL